MEIDFLISAHRKIQLVEVKSSAYRRHSSWDKFMNKFGNRLGERYILYPKDVMVRDGVTHLPLYMAMFCEFCGILSKMHLNVKGA